MSQVVLDAIAASVAQLVPSNSPAREPLGYGTDLSCAEDLPPTMDEVSGDQVLAEAIVRRLTTPRGALPDVAGTDLRDMGFGLDLASSLNRGVTSQEIRALATQTRSEVLKDARLAGVSVTVTPSPAGDNLAVALRVEPANSTGPFNLVLAVTAVGVLVDELRGSR